MTSSVLGVVFHAIGGFAAGSFYLPIKQITNWSWESSWLLNGLFAWLIVPWLVSMIAVPDTILILTKSPTSAILWAYFFGALWGIGGLTFGMTMRYLGISLGMALALGLTAAFGTLIPPIFEGQLGNLISGTPGRIVLAGIGVSLLGIAICGSAGILKDKQLSTEEKQKGVKEFNLRKGVIVAGFAGIMSACFAFGIAAGRPISQMALELGAPALWQNSPLFIVILAGGLTTNLIWCTYLMFKKKTFRDYGNTSASLTRNYLFAAIAGTTWYCQFMFYGMGSTQMGEHDFASWTMHMSFIIVFSTMWGLITKEWKSVGNKTLIVLVAGLFTLILSTIIIGLGNQMASTAR